MPKRGCCELQKKVIALASLGLVIRTECRAGARGNVQVVVHMYVRTSAFVQIWEVKCGERDLASRCGKLSSVGQDTNPAAVAEVLSKGILFGPGHLGVMFMTTE